MSIKNKKFVVFLVFTIQLIMNLPAEASRDVTIPIQVRESKEASRQKEILPPAEVAVIVDLSGSMKSYVPVGSKEDALQYILRNLGAIWIPSVEVIREARMQRYFVRRVYRFARNIEFLKTTDLKDVFSPLPDPDFYKSTEIHEAIKEVVKLLAPKDPKASMVVLISDMEIEIAGSKGFPKGSLPYHVIEPLRELYTQPTKAPGWWFLGVRVPYRCGNKTFLRPIFLSVWGYDVKEIRMMLTNILQDIRETYKGPEGLPEGHLIEISPSDHWIPEVAEKWKPKGIQKFDKDTSPFSWIASHNSFRCEENKKGQISFKIGIPRDLLIAQIESPYRQEISTKFTNSTAKKIFYIDPQSFNLKDDFFYFTVEVFCRAIKGRRDKPDRAEILLNASYRRDEGLLPWLNEWSKKEEPGSTYNSKITNLNHTILGAFKMAPPKKKVVESEPIILEFWK